MRTSNLKVFQRNHKGVFFCQQKSFEITLELESLNNKTRQCPTIIYNNSYTVIGLLFETMSTSPAIPVLDFDPF